MSKILGVWLLQCVVIIGLTIFMVSCGGGGSGPTPTASSPGGSLPAPAPAPAPASPPAPAPPVVSAPPSPPLEPSQMSPQVRLTLGSALGVDDSSRNGTLVWRGLPYAQAPVGPFRWRAPRPAEAWSGVREAAAFGAACMQPQSPYGPGQLGEQVGASRLTQGDPVGSEDCLSLNVWRPAAPGDRLPVLVYIHGGSNVFGYSGDPLYDGAALARRAQAVVVSVNYRLGPFGFLPVDRSTSGVSLEEQSGNFALLDLLEALRFVQREAAAFGGDASQVTVMGQSAGAINLLALMAAPASDGLFQRAIALSPLVRLVPMTEARAQADRLLEGQSLASLRERPAEELLRLTQQLDLGGYGPIADGRLLPLDLTPALQQRRMPLVMMHTADESKAFSALLDPGALSLSEAQLLEVFRTLDPDRPSGLRVEDVLSSQYIPVVRWNLLHRGLTNSLLALNRNPLLDRLSEVQARTLWVGLFEWAQEPAPWNDVFGAAHGFDLPFVFGQFEPSTLTSIISSRDNQPGRLALSDKMMSAISSFVRSGNPNNPSLGIRWDNWPATLRWNASNTDAQLRIESR